MWHRVCDIPNLLNTQSWIVWTECELDFLEEAKYLLLEFLSALSSAKS